ncbi:hypothetical protein D9M68_946660 [compost metagenome]
MVTRIEAANARPWWSAIARTRQFSEYLIYGAAVSSDPEMAARHERTPLSWCLTYWEGPALDSDGLRTFMDQLAPYQKSIAIQSHTETPTALIRDVVLGRD